MDSSNFVSGSTYAIRLLFHTTNWLSPQKKLETVAFSQHNMQILPASNHTSIDFSLFFAMSLDCGRKRQYLEGTPAHSHTSQGEHANSPKSNLHFEKRSFVPKQTLSDQMCDSNLSLFRSIYSCSLFIAHSSVHNLFIFASNTQYRILISPFFLLLTHSDGASLSISVRSSRSRVGT